MIVPGAELVIYSPVASGSPTSVGIRENIPINITIAIADVREPDKRNSTFSKTINIPGSKTVNKLFEHIFDVTTELNDFNPNLKTTCEYYVRSEKVFTGDLQLLRIVRKGISPYVEINYECSIVGRLSNVFLNLGNDLLTDLDWSDLNHTFGYSTRNWTPTLGTGYTYPLIDYGVMGGNGTYWDYKHLKPAVFEKEIIDRIFKNAGKTYTSTFLTSTYYKSILCPDVNEGALKMTASQINAISFYAGKTADTTYSIPLFVTGGIGVTAGSNVVIANPAQFNDDSTSPFYDGGGNFNTGTYIFNVPIAANMASNVRCDFEIRIVPPSGTTNTTIVNGGYGINVSLFNTGYSTTVNPSSTTSWTPFSVTVQMPSTPLPVGFPLYVVVTTDDANFCATQFSGAPVGNGSIELKLKDTSWFSATSGDGTLPIGYTVTMRNSIPKNVRQIDFLMSVIKAENLYMELDPTDSNNYIIEQREDFFLTDASNTLDWTDKWDFQRETTVIPMGELDWREYLFTYKSDGDKFNKLYKDSYGEVYGQEQIYADNDFNKGVKKNELIFASTPLVGNAVNDIVCPVLAQIDGNAVKPMACQPRRLYWGGLLTTSAFQFKNTVWNGWTTTTSYPYAGHVDNPYNPTIDLCFDNPKQLYYTYPGQVYTNNNLYTRNWQKFIKQITDQNSKIVIMWMYLKASDIANFTFRKRIWIHDSYYIVNKIMDYTPQEVSLCRVEFVRLAFVDDPVIDNIKIWNNGEGNNSGYQYGIVVGNPYANPNNLISNSDGFAIGENNVNQGDESNILGGQDNFIGGSLNG